MFVITELFRMALMAISKVQKNLLIPLVQFGFHH